MAWHYKAGCPNRIERAAGLELITATSCAMSRCVIDAARHGTRHTAVVNLAICAPACEAGPTQVTGRGLCSTLPA